ncbi:MAG: hypothetical protein SH857_02515 [Chitinophagales bacterium]|nr:hypothetical protein [Chitinophagales bacterium]
MRNYIILLLAMLLASPAFNQKRVDLGKENTRGRGSEEKEEVKTDAPAQAVDTPKTQTVSAKSDSVAKVATTTTLTDSVAKTAVITTIATTTVAKQDTVIKPAANNTLQMDSLTKVTNLLTAKFNTVNAELEKYRGVYTVLKEKVLKRDFDPEKFAQIVDSLAAGRDSTQIGLVAAAASMKDSLVVFKKEITELKAKVDAANTEDIAKLKLANELKALKEMLDSKILTQTESDSKKALVLQKWK